MTYKIEESIAFNSYNDNFIFSNMYPCKLLYRGMYFYGVDHLYFYLLYYKHPDIQEKIMKCSGICANYKAKQIGEKHKELLFDITSKQCYNLLEKVINLKFEQCELFRQELLNTEKDLVEFAFWGDTEFGCVKQGNNYVGDNITGRILMKIRNNNK